MLPLLITTTYNSETDAKKQVTTASIIAPYKLVDDRKGEDSSSCGIEAPAIPE